MSTYIDGIAASQNLDTAGEIISIEGMDISSLDKSGVFNWEHLKDLPGQVVGKILKAKKIFSEKDCEDDRELYFWKKCLVPYIYVMGVLFDDYKESAKEVAGLFRYDADNEGKQEVDVVGFSVEGQYLQREGSLVKRSIARKCTITTANANKIAIAKMVPAKKPKDSIDSLFKTEFKTHAEIFDGKIPNMKKDEGFTMGTLSASEIKKDQPKLTAAPTAPSHIGHTQSGKPVSATARIHEYKDFSEQDHRDAATTHLNAAGQFKGKDVMQAQFHGNKAILHTGAANSMRDRAKKLSSRQSSSAPKSAASPASSMSTKSVSYSGPKIKSLFDPGLSGKMTPPGPIRKSELVASLSMDEESDALMNRTEDKYIVSKSALDYLTQTIKENLKKGDIDTEVRYNTNKSIYLDNDDLDSLKDALNSKKPRMKIRVRQYSPNGEGWEKVAYVEIKSKEEDGISNKIRIRIFDKDIESFTSGQPIKMSEELANINKDITKQVLEKRISLINRLVALYGYRKQLEIRYERRAYTDNQIRITIDDGIRYLKAIPISEQNALAAKSTEGWVNILQIDHKIKNQGYLILEVKHSGKVPDWVKKCLKNSNAEQVKFSKYCGAITAVIETKKLEGIISSYVPSHENLIMKAMEAGSGMAAPGNLVQGAALAKESLYKYPTNASRPDKGFGAIIHKPSPAPKPGKVIMKSKWLARAEEEYSKWSKREHFENFMAKRMPRLTKGEIKAIGQVMALNKNLTLEKALSYVSCFKHEDKIPGGLADKKKPSDFDSKKLLAGKKVESEHTSDPSIAEEIAMDHLTEDLDYYEKLKRIEKK